MAGAPHDPFLAISSPVRRRMLDLLSREDQPVKALASHFEMSQPAVSQHLRLLRGAGLVSERRVGRERRYRVNGARLRVVHEWVARYERFWRGRLEALGHALDDLPDEPASQSEAGQ
jgi:DNA-binding transcriptional ArsR family regulator